VNRFRDVKEQQGYVANVAQRAADFYKNFWATSRFPIAIGVSCGKTKKAGREQQAQRCAESN
jgi:hypothetical protein